MTVYMLRHKTLGLYYKVGPRCQKKWVRQGRASIWTTISGPVAAKIQVADQPTEIIPFELRETHA